MLYSYHELKEGKSCYKTWSEFLWGRGIDNTDSRPSLNLSLFAYWLGILIWVQIVPPPSDGDPMFGSLNEQYYQGYQNKTQVAVSTMKGSIPDGIPNSFNSMIYLSLEVVTGILLYDTIFFFIHYAMHECKFMAWLTRHCEHHKATKNLEARHVLRHSLTDGILQVLVNIAVQRRTPWGRIKSRFARILHNVLVTLMLTESHSASTYPKLFRGWCVGVREHRNHHLSKYNKFVMERKLKKGYEGEKKSGIDFHRYQQFFGHWDYMRFKYMHRKQL